MKQSLVLAMAVTAAIAIAVALSLLGSAVTTADNGPHQGASFGTKPDACAGCHRIHTAEGPRLLKESGQANLCFTCHNGTGADTNVVDGVYAVTSLGLKGGGFTSVLMDPGLTGTPASASTSSTHTIDGASATAWGGGAISAMADYGNTITLECGNCHNPHGNGQYRVLRRTPNEGYSQLDVTVSDEVAKDYDVSYPESSYYRDTSYVPGNIDEWCSQCHSRYLAGSGSGSNHSGDAVFEFRHMTDSLAGGCLKCHLAHGTTSTMGVYSGIVLLPDDTPGAGSSDSRLLHVDNRGVCAQCHVGSGGVTGGCTACHGQPPATGSHTSHFTATYGPLVPSCDSCHLFADATHMNGQVTFADGAASLNDTAACNTCHSPGGTFDGVADAAIGAKGNWSTGVYGSDLQPGKERWCMGCHDESPSLIQGVPAPDKAGDNPLWFFGKGHGRTTADGSYDAMSWQDTAASGNPAADLLCTSCHDQPSSHIDGAASSSKRLITGFENNQDNDTCNNCHYPGGVASADPAFYVNHTDYEASAHGETMCTDCHALHSSDLNGTTGTYVAMTKANKEDLCRQCHAGQQGHAIGVEFGKGGNTYILECTSCHNVHVITGMYSVSDSTKSPLTKLSSITFVWGDEAGEKMDDFAGSGTYRTPNGDTLSGTQLPDYPSFCLECHGVFQGEFGVHGGMSWGGDEPHGMNSANQPNGYSTCPNWYVCGKATGWDGDDCTGDQATCWPVMTKGKGDQLFSRGPYNHEERIAGANFVLSCSDCHVTHEAGIGSKLRSTVNNGSGSIIWNTMCNNCHYYYSDWHAGMSCGTASCHVSDGSDRMYLTGTNTLHDMGNRTGSGGTRTFNTDLVLDMRFENNLNDSGTWQMDGKWYDGAAGIFASGKYGQAIELNGDQTVQVGTTDSYWSTDEGKHGTWKYTEMKYNATLEAWVYPVYDQGTEYSIFSKHVGYTDGGYAFTLAEIGGTLRAAFKAQIDNNAGSQGGASGVRGAYSSVVVPLNQWSHVAATFDTSGPDRSGSDPTVGRVRIYVNGEDVTTSDSSGDFIQPGPGETSIFTYSENSPWNESICYGGNWCASEFSIGGFTWQNSFLGKIDEAKVWNVTKDALYFETVDVQTAPGISTVTGLIASDQLAVTFSEGVYATAGGAGALEASDFTLADADNGRTVFSVAHAAGASTATLTLSSALDDTDDIGVDTLAAAASAIYDEYGNLADTGPVTIVMSSACPAGATTFQLNESPGSAYVLDTESKHLGTVVGIGTLTGTMFSGDGANNYIDFESNPSCLQASTSVTMEALIKPVGMEGTANYIRRVFARDSGGANYQMSVWRNNDWTNYNAPDGVASIAFWVRPTNAHGGNTWKPVLTDYASYPIVSDHWYRVRVVWDSSKAMAMPGDIFVDDLGTDGAGAGENWAGYRNATDADQSQLTSGRYLEPGDTIATSDGAFTIGASVSNHANNVFNGLIDWISWSPAANYTGVDDPPY